MMTTCNDSFYYGLVNPQIQLCPTRPSAAHLFFSVFPFALLSVVHSGSCGHTNVERMSGSPPRHREGKEQQGLEGKRQE